MTDTAAGRAGALATEITDENIITMVENFYASVRTHPTLAAVFNPRLEGRWDQHLNQMKRFWSSVLLQTGVYQGHPLGAHFGVPGMQREHFADWLDLFRQTLDGIYAEPQADLIHARAQRIAARFSYALFTLVHEEQGNQGTR